MKVAVASSASHRDLLVRAQRMQAYRKHWHHGMRQAASAAPMAAASRYQVALAPWWSRMWMQCMHIGSVSQDGVASSPWRLLDWQRQVTLSRLHVRLWPVAGAGERVWAIVKAAACCGSHGESTYWVVPSRHATIQLWMPLASCIQPWAVAVTDDAHARNQTQPPR